MSERKNGIYIENRDTKEDPALTNTAAAFAVQVVKAIVTLFAARTVLEVAFTARC